VTAATSPRATPMPASRRARPVLKLVTGGRQVKPGQAAPRKGPVRWEKVRTARARISAGFYDRPDVRERVLAAVLRSLDED